MYLGKKNVEKVEKIELEQETIIFRKSGEALL